MNIYKIVLSFCVFSFLISLYAAYNNPAESIDDIPSIYTFLTKSSDFNDGRICDILRINFKEIQAQDLNEAYVQAIKRLKSGWVETSLKDFPNIKNKESEKEWRLFIKTKILFAEDSLIRFLALKFGINSFIECDNAWVKDDGGVQTTDTIYLWIQKKRFDLVMNIFRLQIN
jgi:hypothetical protein